MGIGNMSTNHYDAQNTVICFLVACAIAMMLLLSSCEARSVGLVNGCTLERCSGYMYNIVKRTSGDSVTLVSDTVQAYVIVGDIILGRVVHPGSIYSIDEPVGYFVLDTKSGSREMGLTYERMKEFASERYKINTVPAMKETFPIKKK